LYNVAITRRGGIVANDQAQRRAGYRVEVDLDLEKSFDRVHHDVLLERVGAR
jgi:hypothetical protein